MLPLLFTLLFDLQFHQAAAAAAAVKPPHIFVVIVDDFGFAEVGYHVNQTYKYEVHTPTIDALVAEGVELTRHYVHPFCTPTRTSFQSGRLPVHVLQTNPNPCVPDIMPRNMTGIAEHLTRGGYRTHFVGKWDCGMSTPTHTPKGRGYNTSLNYFGHGNWMYTQNEWQGSYNNRSDVPPCDMPTCFVDFWDTDKPARTLNGTQYEEFIFRDRLYDIIQHHDASQPLFVVYASKEAHYPLQAPQAYQDKFAFIDEVHRRMYHAMVNVLDDNLANLTGLLKSRGMWNDTLLLLTADNGGYVLAFEGDCDPDTPNGYACFNGEAGANNWPLRGGKYSPFEGGIRVNAFLSGGYLPASVRGTKQDGIIHAADWYRTFAELAGVDPTDHRAAQWGLPPIDSLNVWPLVSGQNATSPRTDVLVSASALIHGDYKILVGKVSESNWGGPLYPNMSTATDPIVNYSLDCGSSGCLFNVAVDLEERTDLAAAHPEIVKDMLARLQAASKTIWNRTFPPEDPTCRRTAQSKYGGFLGPWLELES